MAFTREDAEKKCVTLGKNGAYLEVKWRIVWFRENCPNGVIETEMIHFDPDRKGECEVTEWVDNPRQPGKRMPVKKMKEAFGMTVFRATISDGNGGKATATKSENAASFEDYIEKAETGAIGRALALLGYGTQFTGDELAEHHRIVDAPVSADNQGNVATTSNTAPRPQASGRSFQPISATPLPSQAPANPAEQQQTQGSNVKPLASIPTFAGLRKHAVKYLDEMTVESVLKDFNRDNNIPVDREYTPDEIVKLRDILAPMITEAKEAAKAS